MLKICCYTPDIEFSFNLPSLFNIFQFLFVLVDYTYNDLYKLTKTKLQLSFGKVEKLN